MIIAIEGIDGAGKTTQAKLLALAGAFEYLHLPGSSLKPIIDEHCLSGDTGTSGVAKAMLFAADLAQLVKEQINPALTSGKTVVMDRYIGSLYAYQADTILAGRKWLRSWAQACASAQAPLSILLDVSPMEARGRIRNPDTIEARPLAYHSQVCSRLRSLVTDTEGAGFNGHWVFINAQKSVQRVHKEVVETVYRSDPVRFRHLQPLPAFQIRAWEAANE